MRTVDPKFTHGAAYTPTPLYALGNIADAAAGNGDVVGPAGFLERLGWYRDMLADTLALGVPTWEPQRHLYGLVRDFLDRAGKGLRPALCIATVRALGGRAEETWWSRFVPHRRRLT